MKITFVVDDTTQGSTNSGKYKTDTELSARIESPPGDSVEYDFEGSPCKVTIVTLSEGNSVIEILRDKAFPNGAYTLDVDNKKIIKGDVAVDDPNAGKRPAKEDTSALSQPDIIRSLGALIDNIKYIVDNSSESEVYKTAVNDEIDEVFKPGIVGDSTRGGRESFVEIEDDKLPEAITSQQVIGSLRDPAAGVPFYIDIEMTGNSSLANFLKAYAGRSDDPALAVKLVDTGDLSTIADNFEKLLTYLGIKDVADTVINEFDPAELASDVEKSGTGASGSAAAGSNPVAAATDALKGVAAQVKSGVAAATAAVTSAVAGATGSSETSAGNTAATKTAAADSKTAAETVPEPDEGQTIGFYATIFGADERTPATIEIDFNNGIGSDSKTIYNDLDPIMGAKFDKLFAIRVRKEELIAFWKANNGTEATIRITAVPTSGGDAITVERQIPIKWPLRQVLSLLPNEVFRFSETSGSRSYAGLASGEGGGEAKNNRDKDAEVAELYYTKSGGIKQATVGTTVDAVGSTYLFTFDVRDMLVPIEIDAPESAVLKESKKLTEAAVPHWIFLSKRGGSGGRRGEGDTSGGGGDSTQGKKKFNIAVSKFGIKTKGEWIAVPNVGTPWNQDTFKVKIAQDRNNAGPPDTSSLAPILGLAEIKRMNLDMSAIEDAVRNALFGSSAAWNKLGIANNCWARHPSVTGTGGVTAREIAYNVGGAA
jgi:hypothetical protein